MKLESFSRSAIESADIDKAYEKALKFLNEVSPRINPADEEFVNYYGEKNVEEDIEYVKKREKEFSNRIEDENYNKKLATIFEAIILEQIYFSEWLGEDTETYASSLFDDFAKGVDVIVEFNNNEDDSDFLAFAVDATFESDMSRKFKIIKNSIEKGISEVKYFSHNGEIGLKNLPRFVVGADAKTINELVELWLSDDKHAFGEHPIQIQILEEIISQAKFFKEYAIGVDRNEIASKYNEVGERLSGVLKKKEYEISRGNIDSDKVYKAIEEEVENF